MEVFTFGVVSQLWIGREDPGDMHLALAHPGPAALSLLILSQLHTVVSCSAYSLL